jgi:hypothetical protein
MTNDPRFTKVGTSGSSRLSSSRPFTTVGELKALLRDLDDEAALELDKLPVGLTCRGLVLVPDPAAQLVTICEST